MAREHEGAHRIAANSRPGDEAQHSGAVNRRRLFVLAER